MIAPRRDPEIRLRRYWEQPDVPTVSAGLSALSVGYRLALAVRERAYRWRFLGTGRLPIPVVSVGNITLGGSGKTPMVEVVARALRDLGAVPAVVSRGYGRNTRGVHVVADQTGVKLGPRAAGDEPAVLAEHLPGISVIVGENRYEAGRVATQRCGATAIVLDDGFQHRTLHKNLEIVVVNGRAPWGNGRLFPRGMLREPLTALRRADLVVVTNPPDALAVEAVTETMRRHRARVPVLTAAYEVIDAQETETGRRARTDELAGRRLLAFAGLGSPRGFAETLTAVGVSVAGLVEYPDHYWFAEGDLGDLAEQARHVGADGLITTEKDWVRLRGRSVPSTPVWVLAVRLRLETGGEVLQRSLERTLAPTVARR